jgi:DNA replication initiation complex subunit (GINS family)
MDLNNIIYYEADFVFKEVPDGLDVFKVEKHRGRFDDLLPINIKFVSREKVGKCLQSNAKVLVTNKIGNVIAKNFV